MPADEALRARIGALDTQFHGALSFTDLLGLRRRLDP
jgi:hypothetical protein